ncbi:hypothetical protein [Pedobacter sp. NJ-S-72]
MNTREQTEIPITPALPEISTAKNKSINEVYLKRRLLQISLSFIYRRCPYHQPDSQIPGFIDQSGYQHLFLWQF